MIRKLVKRFYFINCGKDSDCFRYRLDYVPIEEIGEHLLAAYDTFESALQNAPKLLPDEAYIGKTFPLNRDCLVLFDRNRFRMSKRTFKPFEIYDACEPARADSYSLNELMRELPADKMAQFLKDNLGAENSLKILQNKC